MTQIDADEKLKGQKSEVRDQKGCIFFAIFASFARAKFAS